MDDEVLLVNNLHSDEENRINNSSIISIISSSSGGSSENSDNSNADSSLSSSSANDSGIERDYLASVDHPHTLNTKSAFSYYFYTNTTTVLSKLVMSYEEQLHKAIVKANYELVNELVVNRRCDVNAMANKRLPLGLAAEYNFMPVVQLLLKHGANTNAFDYYDQTALIYAVGSADLGLIKQLVKHGADVNLCNSNGTYPLHLAITRQDDSICDYLLEQGADVNGCDNLRYSPLSIAISNDYLSIVDKLLSRGADANIADNNGDTPLIKSIWLTMSSSSVSDNRDRIMELAIKLVAAGADVNAKNESGRTALFTAIYQNNTDLALYLIESAGAKCELEDVLMSNFTLLHYACFQGNYTLVKALLDRNCDPNSIATSCESPVYIAVTKGYADIVGLLIEYGADVNVSIGMQNDSKCTALQAALYYILDYSHFRCIVDKLIRGNANLNVSQPAPIIYICLQYNKINFAKYLLAVGASVELRTVFNQSCFYKAFLMKNLEFMKMCIMAGFNMYNEPWISTYLDNPDFIEYTDYYVKMATTNRRAATVAGEFDSSLRSSTSSDQSSGDDDSIDAAITDRLALNELMNKTDQELNDLLNMDEYYFERFHITRNRNRGLSSHTAAASMTAAAATSVSDTRRKNAELAKDIYMFIKHSYSNPLSLKELARIQIRKTLLNVDYRMKYKIEENLPLPKRLKDYLLLKEFNI